MRFEKNVDICLNVWYNSPCCKKERKRIMFDFIFFTENILLGVALAIDAFSVSLANGLNEPCMKMRKMCGIAGMFAFFQALMPFIGWVLI